MSILERFEALQIRFRDGDSEAERPGLFLEFATIEIAAFEAADLEFLGRHNEVSDGRSIARTRSAGFGDQTTSTGESD